MDIATLITRFQNTYIRSGDDINTIIQEYLKTINDSIIQASEEGSNSLVYEILTLSGNDINRIRGELLTLFPDMDITISGKRLIIDWS